MFGPNVKTEIRQAINFHHREDRFFGIYKDLRDTFRSKFELSSDYDLVFVNGSGTLAVETVVHSYLGKFRPLGVEGKFRSRWESLLGSYGKLDPQNGKSLYCQLETSRSTMQEFPDSFFVDCISSFPYVLPPSGSRIWVTVSSKILGAAPVLGIIVYRKDILHNFVDRSFYSYLSFLNLVEFQKYNQTPQTPPIPLYMDFLEKLGSFDRKECVERINYRCGEITRILGAENFIGDARCPVLTVDKSLVGRRLDKYHIYGSNSTHGRLRQIFVYSQDDAEFDSFIKDLKKC